MVKDNGTTEPKKRKGLFGGRRAAAQAASAATPELPPAVPETPISQAPVSEAPVSVTPVEATAPPAAPEAQADVEAATASDNSVPARKAPARRKPAGADTADSETADSETGANTPADATAEAPKTATRSRSRKPAAEREGAASANSNNASADDASAESAAGLKPPVKRPLATSLLFQAPDIEPLPALREPREPREPRAARGPARSDDTNNEESGSVRRRSRRRPGEEARDGDDAPGTVVRVRQPRPEPVLSNEPTRVKGSTRLEAKKQRRRDGRDAGRRRPVITESEFLARRESVDRTMIVRSKFDRIQIAVLEDGVLVEHYVAKSQDMSLIGNVYLGRVQNVLPSMEAAFVDIGRGRNAVLYSGEVDWEAAAENSADGKQQARRIELALKPGDKVLVQVTKDPVGHKGARLTSQVSLPGRYLVYVPNGSMNGISRKLPDTERARLKKILKEVLPENTGVIVRTAAEGATEEQLTLDVQRLTNQWAEISRLVETANAPVLLHSEPDLLIKIIRDVFNEDFHRLIIEGRDAQDTIEAYLRGVAPDLIDRVESYEGNVDSFDAHRVSEQIEKALDRKVWLPSGGSLVIDRTEAMTVVDVNTGKFVGSGGNLEETVTKNNLESAEEIVRQLRLRDIGGIIVVDFIDMVLESNRDLVLRRLVECLSRDRTKHQVAEVTSLGLVQMTRKKLGLGLLETFSEPCEQCAGRGIIVHHDPVTKHRPQVQTEQPSSGRRGRGKGGAASASNSGNSSSNQGGSATTAPKNGNGAQTHAITEDVRHALAQIAASTVPHSAESTDAPAPVEAPAAPETQDAQQHGAPEAVVAAAEAAVAILDIPVAKTQRNSRRISTKDAEQILDSVLEALPEPKQAGQGRRTSRRAGSAGAIVSAPITDN
ncbi:MAG: Rne/Rng family ribonuclease [Microbacteriaceae bacterium]